jgi:DinB superfamily
MLRGEQLDWPADYALIPLALEDAKRAEAFTWHRPEHMDPRIHPPQGDVQAMFLAQMTKLENTLEVLPNGWGHWQKTMMSVNDLGKLDVYQFIVFLCKHALRHCAQMEGNLREMAQGQ